MKRSIGRWRDALMTLALCVTWPAVAQPPAPAGARRAMFELEVKRAHPPFRSGAALVRTKGVLARSQFDGPLTGRSTVEAKLQAFVTR